MADSTLNSRLRVLAAKTFRAEKLYGSIRNSSEHDRIGPAALADLANDLRAKEWQRMHQQLRSGVNELLGLGAGPAVAAGVAALHRRFSELAAACAGDVERGTNVLAETAKRLEFAHSFKLSFDLIQIKARSQACKAIADELGALLDQTSRETSTAPVRKATAENPQQLEETEVEPARSNVIPLRRAGGRSRR